MIQKILRFVYLNTYAFVCLFVGILAISVPLWHLSLYCLIPQGIAAIAFIAFSVSLFGMWGDKIREYKILMERNKKEFRPDTFKIYMDAPCGRKLVRAVLKDLGKESEYKGLLIYKPSLKEAFIECW